MSTIESTSDERTQNNTMRHQYRILTDGEKDAVMTIKDKGLDFLELIRSLEVTTSPTREFAIAKTKIEEAVMWAVKSITR